MPEKQTDELEQSTAQVPRRRFLYGATTAVAALLGTTTLARQLITTPFGRRALASRTGRLKGLPAGIPQPTYIPAAHRLEQSAKRGSLFSKASRSA